MNASMSLIELQHKIWQLTLPDQLILAPIASTESGEVRDVIDIRCGKNEWSG